MRALIVQCSRTIVAMTPRRYIYLPHKYAQGKPQTTAASINDIHIVADELQVISNPEKRPIIK